MLLLSLRTNRKELLISAVSFSIFIANFRSDRLHAFANIKSEDSKQELTKPLSKKRKQRCKSKNSLVHVNAAGRNSLVHVAKADLGVPRELRGSGQKK